MAKQDLTIKLPRKFFVTDVRMGKQLGYTDVIHASILIGDALVFALSPRESDQGRRFCNRATGSTRAVDRSLKYWPGLIRCHVYSPGGMRLAIYSTNVLLQNGKSTFVVPFALNDEPGRYVIRATDVVRGEL